MKKIRLFSAKAIKGIEGEEAELYVNFYLVLNKDYIFTFAIEAPNLMCSDRHPFRLWKHFLMMLEEENVKYMRRYENTISKRVQGITREDEEALNIWAHSKGVIEVLTSYPMGAWLHQRDERVVDDILNNIKAEIKKWYWQADKQALAKDPCVIDAMIDLFIRTIDKRRAESEAEQ